MRDQEKIKYKPSRTTVHTVTRHNTAGDVACLMVFVFFKADREG